MLVGLPQGRHMARSAQLSSAWATRHAGQDVPVVGTSRPMTRGGMAACTCDVGLAPGEHIHGLGDDTHGSHT